MALDLDQCLYISTNSLSKRLSSLANDAFLNTGLSPSYAFLLMAVNDEPGIQPSRLSGILQLTPSTITRLIEKMEYHGYLKRESEGRATYVQPTQKSYVKDKELRAAWEQLQAAYNKILGSRYTEVLTELSVKALQEFEEI